mmetsp:Transcript_36633/g.62905  ORF Transcript_36633/g.62905 Transcript_36633/m.62905 type:complete len:108 (+) Transcript_36633:28-351(+)
MDIDITDIIEDSMAEQRFQLLPCVISMLQCVNKNDSDGASQAAQNFQKKIKNIKEHIESLPGINLSETQQKQLYKDKKEELTSKQEKINKHVNTVTKDLSVYLENVE